MVLGDDNHHPLLISPPESPAEDESLRVQESDDGDLIGRTWSESKKIWHIAGPAIFTRIAMFSLTVITQSFAGHLGDLDMAAISIVATVLIGITFGFLVKS